MNRTTEPSSSEKGEENEGSKEQTQTSRNHSGRVESREGENWRVRIGLGSKGSRESRQSGEWRHRRVTVVAAAVGFMSSEWSGWQSEGAGRSSSDERPRGDTERPSLCINAGGWLWVSRWTPQGTDKVRTIGEGESVVIRFWC